MHLGLLFSQFGFVLYYFCALHNQQRLHRCSKHSPMDNFLICFYLALNTKCCFGLFDFWWNLCPICSHKSEKLHTEQKANIFRFVKLLIGGKKIGRNSVVCVKILWWWWFSWCSCIGLAQAKWFCNISTIHQKHHLFAVLCWKKKRTRTMKNTEGKKRIAFDQMLKRNNNRNGKIK